MTPARHLLSELRAHGVRVVVEGDALRLAGPRRPPEPLLERVRAEKPALLRLLRGDGRPGPALGPVVFAIADVFGPGCAVITSPLDAPAQRRAGGHRP